MRASSEETGVPLAEKWTTASMSSRVPLVRFWTNPSHVIHPIDASLVQFAEMIASLYGGGIGVLVGRAADVCWAETRSCSAWMACAVAADAT